MPKLSAGYMAWGHGFADAQKTMGIIALATFTATKAGQLEEALKIAEISRLEVHGPEEELAKLREPLAELKPQFFILEYGFRR